jgi:hypothetical protein
VGFSNEESSAGICIGERAGRAGRAGRIKRNKMKCTIMARYGKENLAA